jgi:cytochrome c oxidase subunit 4
MSAQVVPVRTYAAVFLALLALLALTLIAAGIEHAAASLAIALAIAVAKATLIVLFFMNVRAESPVVRMAAVAGFLWLAILMALSLADLLTRAEAPSAADGRVSQVSGDERSAKNP